MPGAALQPCFSSVGPGVSDIDTIISLFILTFKVHFYIYELYYFSFSSFYKYTLISHNGLHRDIFMHVCDVYQL